jgi:2-methylcitrate dehydratase PrpD
MMTSVTAAPLTAAIADFILKAIPPPRARERAAIAVTDAIGVALAGAPEPAARIIRSTIAAESRGSCRILGAAERASAAEAAFANGVAIHALDFDDMCFVSMAHPSCALVPAALAAAELADAAGRAVLDAYIVGFELECRLGMTMNPRHYHARGWHCTSSIGTLGAAAAASRLLELTPSATVDAIGIAASLACGLKENIGTMVKPLHAGVAARNGVMAARLARHGLTASEIAIDGPQGYLAAMDSERPPSDFAEIVSDLGRRWEILDTGISVKLYPSCAATHPPLDALLQLVREHAFTGTDVDAIEVEVDSMTPRLLIHDRPSTELEAKFSMPFCAAAAIVFGHPTIETFAADRIQDSRVQQILPRVTMKAQTAFDAAAPLSQAIVTVRLRDGRTLSQRADGARGYPGRLTDEELATKFLGCAERSLSRRAARLALQAWRAIDTTPKASTLMAMSVAER